MKNHNQSLKLLKPFTEYKANFIFEFDIKTLPLSKAENNYLKKLFFDAIVLSLNLVGFRWILFYFEISEFKTIACISICGPSKYREALEFIVNQELSERGWFLCDFYDKSHSFLGVLKRFRFSVPEQKQLVQIQIRINPENANGVSIFQVRKLLNSIYPSTFINWKSFS